MTAPSAKSLSKLLILLVAALLIAVFFHFDLNQYLRLEFLKSQQAAFQAFYDEHRFATLGIYFLLYVVTTALSLPGATILTLAGGALFGFGVGLLVVSFASTIGATCAFLAARYILRDGVQAKFGDRLRAINTGIEKEGAFYLFILRLIPIFPFFVINLVMGLTPLAARTFYWVSQAGMLPGTAVYVNAGTQLAQIESVQGILSPQLLASFALLGLFPWLVKKLVPLLRRN